MASAEPRAFVVDSEPQLHGETLGEGPAVVLCHGITATRRYVLHGSKALARAGYAVTTYDARGHGESRPAPEGEGYGYPQLVGDLERIVDSQLGDQRFVLGGHSMGAHTAAAYALRHPERLDGLVLIGPTYLGRIEESSTAYWEGLAGALEKGGIEGFVEYIGANQGIDPVWRSSVLRFTRARMLLQQSPDALVRALRETPRSRPFEDLEALRSLHLPALVVASRDEADPGHPYAAAAAYAEALPRACLVSEGEGESPLAWQGGRLSREIVAFCREAAIFHSKALSS